MVLHNVTGALTERDFLNAIQEYHPEQVLLGRFEYRVLDEYLQSDYRLVHSHDNMRLYIRKDLKGS